MDLKIKRKQTKSKRYFSWLRSRQTHLILHLAVCKTPRRAHTFCIKGIVGYTLPGSYRRKEVRALSYMVARMQKMKADNLVGIGNHNQRKTENHSNKDIDVERSHLNCDLVDGRTENYKTDIQQFIDEKKAGTRATRKDAVLVNEWIISSDRGFFEDKDPKEIERFFKDSKDYFADKFGDDNIRYAQVHLDETTPHMHLGVVPFDENNKLSAKRIFNRATLIEIQDELPVFMQGRDFDIQRGEKGSERKNLTVPEYKSMKQELNKLNENKEKLSDDVSKLEKDYEKYQVVVDTVDDIDVKTEPVMKKKGFLNREEIETDQVMVSKGDFERLHEAYRYVPTLKSELVRSKQAEKAQADEKMQFRAERNDFKRENSTLRKKLERAIHIITRLNEFLEEKLGISVKSVLKQRPEREEPIQERSQESERGR